MKLVSTTRTKSSRASELEVLVTTREGSNGHADHHRSDSARSSVSSTSYLTTDSSPSATDSLFHESSPPHRATGRPRKFGAASATSDERAVDSSLGVDRSPSSTEALSLVGSLSKIDVVRAISSGSLARSQSWASTTPTSPDEDPCRREDGKSATFGGAQDDIPPSAADGAPTSLDGDQGGILGSWKADYSYAESTSNDSEKCLPPLMLSNLPIPPSRSGSLVHSSTRPNAVGSSPQESLDSGRIVRSDTCTKGPERTAQTQDRESLVSSAMPATSPSTSPRTPLASPTRSIGASTISQSNLNASLPLGQRSQKEGDILPRPSPPATARAGSTGSVPEVNVSAVPDSPPAVSASSPSPPSSLSFRSTLSRSARSFRNSFLWHTTGGHAPSASSSARTPSSPNPSPIHSSSVSPRLSDGHFASVASTRAGCSPSPSSSEVSLHKSTVSQDVSPYGQAQPRSTSPFIFRRSSKQASYTQNFESNAVIDEKHKTISSLHWHAPLPVLANANFAMPQRPSSTSASTLGSRSSLHDSCPNDTTEASSGREQPSPSSFITHLNLARDAGARRFGKDGTAPLKDTTFSEKIGSSKHSRPLLRRDRSQSEGQLPRMHTKPTSPSILTTSTSLSVAPQIEPPKFSPTDLGISSFLSHDFIDPAPDSFAFNGHVDESPSVEAHESQFSSGKELDNGRHNEGATLATGKLLEPLELTSTVSSSSKATAVLKRLTAEAEAHPQHESRAYHMALTDTRSNRAVMDREGQTELPEQAALVGFPRSTAWSPRSQLAPSAPVHTPGSASKTGEDDETQFFDAMSDLSQTRSSSVSSFTSPAYVKRGGTRDRHTSHAPVSPSASQALMASSKDLTNSRRGSISRTLSAALEPLHVKKTVTDRNLALRALPSSPRNGEKLADTHPPRAETSLGFTLKNALRRERKSSTETYLGKSDTVSKSGTSSAVDHSNGLTSSKAVSLSSITKSKASRMAETPPKKVWNNVGKATLNSSPPVSWRYGSASYFSPPSLPKVGRSSTTNSLRYDASSPSKASQQVPPAPSSYQAPSSRSILNRSPPMRISSISSKSSPRKAMATSAAKESPPSKELPKSIEKVVSLPTMTRYICAEDVKPVKRVGASRPTQSPSSSAVCTQPLNRKERRSSLTRRSPQKGPTDYAKLIKKGSKQRESLNHADNMVSPWRGGTVVPPRRRKSLSKPVLPRIKTDLEEPVAEPFERPSTVMGMNSSFERRTLQKSRQPTLDMIDDREFLEALEQVRARQRERIAAEAVEVATKEHLARLGMLSGHHRNPQSHAMANQEGLERGRSLPKTGSSAEAPAGTSRLRRSASADARLSTLSSSEASQKGISSAEEAVRAAVSTARPAQPTSGLEWGVGKAAGKLRDGAFVNDDDWKKEVKALFLIRELVQTERSYARHLASLLAVAKRPFAAAPSTHRRKGSVSLMGPAGVSKQVSGPPPSHIVHLRTLLPQLIALSRALTTRIEENPTSAGVGAAFEVLGAQLEATFVSWSGVISDVMRDLRVAEAPRSKAKEKLGLIPLLAAQGSEVGFQSTEQLSPTRESSVSMIDALALGGSIPTLPAAAPSSLARSLKGPKHASTTGRMSKRRSTMTEATFVPMQMPAKTADTAADGGEEHVSRPSSPWGFASIGLPRSSGHSKSASAAGTPATTPTSIKSGPLAMTTRSSSSSAVAGGVKSLTAMDIVIMPTQRIPRYGLLLRDLLSNTPPMSLSHVRVQRALCSIHRVAQLCDAISAPPSPIASGSSLIKSAPAGSTFLLSKTPLSAGSGGSLSRR
ncbi:hypothetical protein IE53DRAFT_69752 [Violaceomyces palustris]|uniref:Uncharacterized protein n=1 Tax=Violaceomyces palustris TaxID=1673888 RepID=A0ACD0P8M7_9BASI|nr:hypothetical protein IE53DRAFT_69752 [Violaceomyces palustris]